MEQVPTTTAGQEHGRELEVLTTVATALNGSASLSEALQISLTQVAELLHLRTGWVWLLDGETAVPYLAAARNLPAALRDHPERLQGRCQCLSALAKGELDAAANVVTCSRLEWLAEGTAGLRFHASVPLHARGERVGVLNVASREWRELSPDELRLLRVVGDMVGLGIERSRLFERCAVAGAAEERNRLAREIHDTLAQGLAGTAMQLETADALLEEGAGAERVREVVQQALQSTRQNLEDVRRSVLDLRPRPLQERSLPRALRELCRERTSAGGPSISFTLSGQERLLPPAVEAGLYRVAQEAVANALRHADPGSVLLTLVLEEDRVTLAVEDDGRGFSGATSCRAPEGETPHFGLVGMCERLRLLGGHFDVQSTPAEGTRVLASVPLS